MTRTITLPDVGNEPLIDWGNRQRDSFGKITHTIRAFRESKMGDAFFPLIAGRPIQTSGHIFQSANPANPAEIIGRMHMADDTTVDEAVSSVLKSDTIRGWAQMSLSRRAPYLRAVARELRKHRALLIALIMLEVGKSAPRDDAEVCEAIDFLEHYAAYAEFLEMLGGAMLFSPKGEENQTLWKPCGGAMPILASIQPWNFPVAISVGPAAAALVTGHAVLYKPAEQSSVIGFFLTRMFYEAGIPPELFHFLPGTGETVGRALVAHPRVNAVAFTGSQVVRREIETSIRQRNENEWGLYAEGYAQKKGVALESGGKNAIIVFPDANLDRVIEDVSDSAFAFQGQMCSACSRLIVVCEAKTGGEKTYDEIVARLKERMESFSIGSPEDPKHQIGPLIDEAAMHKVNARMDRAAREGTVLARGVPVPQNGGYYVSPMLVGDLSPQSETAQEEIFGPVLSVFKAKTYEEARRIANGTNFALTGGVHARNPEKIAQVMHDMDVGAFYANKRTIGAMVGRQPFGGFRESGNGTKAGGWTYLLPFLKEVSVSRNTMECGIPLG